MKVWNRKSCCVGSIVGALLLVVGAVWLVNETIHEIYSRHEIGTYQIDADEAEVRIPFDGLSKSHLYFDMSFPASEKSDKELVADFLETTVSLSAMRGGKVVYTNDLLIWYGLRITRDKEDNRVVPFRTNLPWALFDADAGGIDELRVSLDESRTSLPRPLTVRVFYMH